ncbi:hypothetical protein [Bosea sp. MMO-172]|uniref:hypothetical protein n=1 Tax=Bosea sp. MMO-172 TaxID=3127885 RepID=UPI00301B1CE1
MGQPDEKLLDQWDEAVDGYIAALEQRREAEQNRHSNLVAVRAAEALAKVKYEKIDAEVQQQVDS